MQDLIEFKKVLELFEAKGWKLQKIWSPYRVFTKIGELPWLIPVRDGKVSVEYVEKFKQFCGENE